MTLRLSSPAFPPGSAIPPRHGGDAEDVSPPLAWGTAPAGTVELCVLCEDPDAPRPQPWVHWLVAGLSPTRTGIDEAEEGLLCGQNDFGDRGYGGPMPPKGHGVHRYVFTVFALRRPSGLHKGFSKADMLQAIQGHVLEQAELVGTYERR